MTMSAGVLVCGWRRGQEAEPQGCLFPVEVLRAEGVWGHSRAVLQGRDPPAAHLGTREHQLPGPSLQVALPYSTCATLPAWQKESMKSLQGFSMSYPLQLGD